MTSILHSRSRPRRALGKSDPSYSTITATYGEILLPMKRYPEARAAFDESLAVVERDVAGSHRPRGSRRGS